jgi:periplasmic divalent cation tolerance protein
VWASESGRSIAPDTDIPSVPTVFVTAPRESGADLARMLVEERLAACVNRVDCASTYRWEDAVHDDEETILLAKTTTERVDELVDRVAAEHPYDVPCIERFDEQTAVNPFGTWIEDVTGKHSGG